MEKIKQTFLKACIETLVTYKVWWMVPLATLALVAIALLIFGQPDPERPYVYTIY